MSVEHYRHPVRFYALATAIPWVFWLAEAFVSHLTPTSRLLATATGVLGVVGLLGPTAIAFAMMWPPADLRRDPGRRPVGLRGVRPVRLVLTAFPMLASILLAQAVSLLFGHSTDHFQLAGREFFVASFPVGSCSSSRRWCRSGRGNPTAPTRSAGG